MRTRRETVEHPFGTLKMRMGATHFMMKTLPKVATDMALYVLAYNLTRVMNIVGIKPLVVEAPGGGFASKSRGQPHAIGHTPGSPMPSTDRTRDPVPVAGDAERSVPDARGTVSGGAEGE
jgi:DDE family transposase